MSSRLEEQLRADIVEVGRRMDARGYVASNDGNTGTPEGEAARRALEGVASAHANQTPAPNQQ